MRPAAPGGWPEAWFERLVRRLQAAPGPIVQVWGWPGSGQGLLLRALADRRALEVPPAALSDPATLVSAASTARDQGLEYLLCRRWPGGELRRGLDELLSRPLIVFTSRSRQTPDPDSDDVIGPWELALTAAEISSLWRAETGTSPAEADARRLRRGTDGWIRPLELIARAFGEGRIESLEAGALVALPEVQGFLETEVLAPLSRPSGEALLGLEAATAAEQEELRGRGLLWLGADGQIRSPHLLRALGELRSAHPELPQAPPAPARARGPAAPPAPVDGAVATFRCQFFGPPQVWREAPQGRHRVVWRLRRALKMFAFLLSQPGQRASRLNLVEAAFSNEGLEAVRRNFHPTLSILRRCLSEEAPGRLDVIGFREGFYELDRGIRWDVDADEFRERMDSGTRLLRSGHGAAAVEEWQKAWKLYRGPFLEGYEEGWILDRREAHYRSYLTLLRDLGDALSEMDRLPAALDAYRALLVEDPLQEAVQVAVMGLYAAQGRRDLVRRQYDRLSKLLNEELGVEPLQATTLAYHRLMG